MQRLYFQPFLLLVFLFVCNSLCGQTYVNINASGNNNGSSWGDAYTDLSDALLNTSTGEIWIAAGTYHPGSGTADSSSTFFINAPIALYGGFAGTESSINERDIENNPTFLSGDILDNDQVNIFDSNKTDNVQHVIVVDSLLANPVIFDGLNIIGGHTSDISDQSEFFWRGGGIFTYSTIQVNNCHFQNNFGRSGAGVYVSPSVSTGGGINSSFTASSFSNNNSSSQSAGIFLNEISDVTISDCDFSNNQTTRGAFYPLYCSNVSIDNCTFSNNATNSNTAFGGAVFNWNSTDVTFSNCIFTENSAGNGGALFYNGSEVDINASNLVLYNCTFTDNQAFDFGGGGLYDFSSSLTIDSCTFEDNNGPNGGHLFLGGSDKEVIIQKSTFLRGTANFGAAHTCYGTNANYILEDNNYNTGVANTSGGGIIVGFQANLMATNCTFSENQAQFGGAIYTQNDSTFVNYENCIFEANSSETSGGAIYQNGGIQGAYNNCQFLLNIAEEFGGAIFANVNSDDLEPGLLDLNNTIFNFNNSDIQGGAVNLSNIDANISNCLIVNNFVALDGNSGGAISNNTGDSTNTELNIINSTIAFNQAPIGAGISQFTDDDESFANMTIQNCILINNGNNYEIEEGSPTVVSNGGNISSDASTIGILDNASDQHEIDDMKFVDAPAFDYHLTAESPAVDAGESANAPPTDLDGNPRIGEVDAGSYEFDPSTSANTLNIDHAALEISPNPVADLFHYSLENNWTGRIELSIYSNDGRIVRKWSKDKHETLFQESFPIQAIPAGNYRLVARLGDAIASQGFIKK